MAGVKKMLKMQGPVGWFESSVLESGQITRAILRDEKKLVIGLRFEGWEYSVNLERRHSDLYAGTWSCSDGTNGHASAKLYTSASGELLFGDRIEVQLRYNWYAELCIVKRFSDEEAV